MTLSTNLKSEFFLEPVLYHSTVDSPVGRLVLVANDRALCALLYERSDKIKLDMSEEVASEHHPVLQQTKKELAEYFAGKRKVFEVPLQPSGTVFQLKTWKTLRGISYGQTISYGEQATRMGDANKARAVGMANGRNPISIIVPCHRVIGASGGLTGYAGGLNIKEFLLKHEARHK